jgi:hypothetical protein
MSKNFSSFLFISLLLALFFSDILFAGRTLSSSSLVPGTAPYGSYGFSGHRPAMPFSFDIAGNALVNEPNPYILRNALDKAALPAWNQREGFGMPLIANLNTEVLNPLKLFLNLFPGPYLQDVFYLLRLLVMGIFTFLFLRERKLPSWPALLGSSFFMLSGYSIWWINLHPLSTVMYLPAVFYFYERWGNRGGLKSPFLMSLFLCFALVSGKIPDVLMGLTLLLFYAAWKGAGEDSLRGLCREWTRVFVVTVSGALMAAAALMPFLELYFRASPLAKAIRTGAASHSIPLITSVSLLQPLFLGWRNYFYGSWLKWSPEMLLPHAGIVVAFLSIYALSQIRLLKKTVPFLVFSLLVFFMVYGIFPSRFIARLPVFESVEFLKYNAMFYFCLAVMSAHAFEDLLSEKASRKKFVLSIIAVSLIVLVYFFSLPMTGHGETKRYIAIVLFLSLCAVLVIGLSFFMSRRIFGVLVFSFLILELFLYMPKDHPDRSDPYLQPPYVKALKEKVPYRIIGDGASIPPLVSNAVGLYDTRGISVLLPRDYYMFFEDLLSFSVPQTNSPMPLFSATSPFIDLTGTKYILSREKLAYDQLGNEVSSHIASLRWIRFFDAMISHKIEGGASYGFFNPGPERRFSFFFPMRFRFETKLRVSEPFLFAGFAMKNAPKNEDTKVKITVENKTTVLPIKGEGVWEDRWIDVSSYEGEIVTVTIEGDGSGTGTIVLGSFGLSPGRAREETIYEKLLSLHKKEIPFIEYRGMFEGIHVYENSNVMDRAFVLHGIKTVGNLDDVIRQLQEGSDFREVALVTQPLSNEENRKGLSPIPADADGEGDKVTIKKYASDEVAVDVRSGGGLLVLSDLYYPGWRVKVNGREKKIIKTFGLFRGVFIGSGRSEVIFSYKPLSFYVGMVISLATFIAWILVLYAKRRRLPAGKLPT